MIIIIFLFQGTVNITEKLDKMMTVLKDYLINLL